MKLGIDASNLRRGGGVTHLVEFCRSAQPRAHGFSEMIVWSGRETLSRIEDQPWLTKAHETKLDGNLLDRVGWQRFELSRRARAAGCDVLFVPGGLFMGDFHPMVTISQNLLPFEWRELRRFGVSLLTLKFTMLRFAQTRTFRRSDGLILLTEYARDTVMRVVKATAGTRRIIAHGVDDRFDHPPRPQRSSTDHRPLSLLYVSIIDEYKHQESVARAVAALRESGLNVTIDFVGPAYGPALRRLERRMATLDPAGTFLKYAGPVPYEQLPNRYAAADVGVFASSCENLPMILLEGMRSGLPIACSNRGPMPEVLGDAGVYFDPEQPMDVARTLRRLIDDPALRSRLAAASYERSKAFSCRRSADETLAYLGEVATRNKGPTR